RQAITGEVRGTRMRVPSSRAGSLALGGVVRQPAVRAARGPRGPRGAATGFALVLATLVACAEPSEAQLLPQLERASVDSSGSEANGSSIAPVLSFDGRWVAFTSEATNLVAGDENGSIDVFVHDRVTGTTERVSVDSTGAEGQGPSRTPAIS